METSTNFGFNLPSRDNDDIADINQISDNFRIIDEIMKETEQTFSGTSENPQSGTAVAGALSGYVPAEVGKGLSSNDFTNEDKKKLYSALQDEDIDQIYNPESTNAQSGKAVSQAMLNKISNAEYESINIKGTKLIEVNTAEPLSQELNVTLSSKNILYMPYDNTFVNETPSTLETVTKNGLSFKPNLDGSISIWGTATANTNYFLRNYYLNPSTYTRLDMEAGTYTLSLRLSDGSFAPNTIRFIVGGSWLQKNPAQLVLNQTTRNAAFLTVVAAFSATEDNPVIVFPQIEKRSFVTSFERGLNKNENVSEVPTFPQTNVTFSENNQRDIIVNTTDGTATFTTKGSQKFSISTDLPFGISFECSLAKPKTVLDTIYQSQSASNGISPLRSYKEAFDSGDKIVLENLNLNKKNNQMVFFAKITEMGTLTLRRGNEVYNSGIVTINNTNVVVKTFSTEYTERLNVAHGLELIDYIGVILSCNNTNGLTVKIITNGGIYTSANKIWWGVSNGEIEVENQNGSYTEAVFSYNCDDYKKSIWAFGDSYFDFYNSSRWTKYLIDWGYDTFLADGFPGAQSENVYSDFLNRLNYGTPKYSIWCLGMNDADTNNAINPDWLNYANKFIERCIEKGIEPIFGIIPNTPNKNHIFKNSWIKESGYRYIDFAEAVGASSYPSNWYSNMLSQDNIHPTEQGAIALAIKAITDVPEFLQK